MQRNLPRNFDLYLAVDSMAPGTTSLLKPIRNAAGDEPITSMLARALSLESSLSGLILNFEDGPDFLEPEWLEPTKSAFSVLDAILTRLQSDSAKIQEYLANAN